MLSTTRILTTLSRAAFHPGSRVFRHNLKTHFVHPAWRDNPRRWNLPGKLNAVSKRKSANGQGVGCDLKRG
jgi:hypothetical protein